MAWTTPRTWVASETLTAALLNTHVRDNLNYLKDGAAWSSYTPAWYQGLSLVTKTVNHCTYFRQGRVIHYWGSLTATGAGASTNTVYIQLPVQPAYTTGNRITCGTGFVYDNTAVVFYPGIAVVDADPTGGGNYYASFFDTNASVASKLGNTGSNFTAALASSDIIGWQITYEAAS